MFWRSVDLTGVFRNFYAYRVRFPLLGDNVAFACVCSVVVRDGSSVFFNWGTVYKNGGGETCVDWHGGHGFGNEIDAGKRGKRLTAKQGDSHADKGKSHSTTVPSIF